MGMITNTDLEEGLSFGPLPTSLMIADPAYLIAHTTTDRLAELPTIHTDPKKLSEPIRLIEWVCNVRCARSPDEQNVELIRLSRTGKSFYRITRPIAPNEELLVWFRRQDLEPLASGLLKNPLIRSAWLGHKLDGTAPSDPPKSLTVPEPNRTEEENAEPFTCSRCGAQFKFIYPFVAHHLFKCPLLFSIPFGEPDHPKLETPLSSPGILNELSMNILKTNLLLPFEAPTPALSSNLLPSQPNILEFNPEPNPVDRHVGPDPGQTYPSGPTWQDKLQRTEAKAQMDLVNPTPKSLAYSPLSELDLSLRGPPESGNSLGSIIASLHNKYAIQSNASKSTPTSQSRLNRSTNHTSLGYTPGPTRKSRSKSGLSSLKTRNPLVEQLLQTLAKKPDNLAQVDSTTSTTINPGLVLAQNWCARCSITFRLTSDLVHHMRTHHNQVKTSTKSSSSSKLRRNALANASKNQMQAEEEEEQEEQEEDQEEPDVGVLQEVEKQDHPDYYHQEKEVCLISKHAITVPHGSMRSKHSVRADKPASSSMSRLNCDLCGEVFREKHHLTRHMLSHS